MLYSFAADSMLGTEIVQLEQLLGYEMSDRGIGVSFTAELKDTSLPRDVYTCSGANLVLYTVATDRDVKLTTHFHLVPRLRMIEPSLHSPVRHRGMVSN
jgi:hypothetical protein